MDIVINYDPNTKEYKVYEPSTDSMIISLNLTEGLVNLNLFLKTSGLISEDSDILLSKEITYHLDSETFVAMIQSNVELLKRLQNAPSEFKKSAGKFGLPSASQKYIPKSKRSDGFSGNGKNSSGEFSRGSKNFSSGSFGGSSGFGKAKKSRFG